MISTKQRQISLYNFFGHWRVANVELGLRLYNILQEVQQSGHAADVLSKWVQVSLSCKAAEQSAVFH